MDKPRILTGEALVAKGVTKIDASLPEIGLKDVTPNGSWLEQKQVQAALEARKYLIEVERIEKCGNLSHAAWRDEIMLAEVTQKVGGYWHYLGHNVGKTLYLKPEEALFLMEVNCLLLKHNGVTVSLQKAYSLLLRSPISMIQYKVYASLSRLGYKVFRHKSPADNDKNSHCVKFKSPHESNKIDSPTVSKEKASENVDSISADINKSNSDDTTTISTENASDNNNTPDKVNSVNDSTSADSTKASTDTDNKKSATADEIITSGNLITPKDEILHESDENYLVVETNANKVNEDIGRVEKSVRDVEASHNIVKITKSERHEELAKRNDTENNIANENNAPNRMEVDETIELKIEAVAESEDLQEVSSTVPEDSSNIENKTDSMETTENKEAMDSGVILMEGDTTKKMDGTVAEEVNNMITDIPVDSGCLTGTEVSVDKSNEYHTVKYETKCETDKEAITTINEDIVMEVMDTDSQKIEDKPHCHDDLTNNGTGNSNNSTQNNDNHSDYSYSNKIEKLVKRQLKSNNPKNIEKYFEHVPEIKNEELVSVKVPDPQFIPKNIFVNKSNYLLNLQNIKQRSLRTASTESASYTSSDEVNGTNVRRIRSSSATEYSQPNFFPQVRFPRHHFRPYGSFWRPQNNINFYQFSMYFQRPTFPQMYYQSRVQYLQRSNPFLRTSYNLSPNVPNTGNSARKRMRNGRAAHLQGIKNLAVRLKQWLVSGNTDMRNLESLHSLLHSYNLRYKSRLRLTDNFDIINEEKILETIELDDEDESKSKKPKLDQDDCNKFDENLYRLRQLATRLRDLETKDKATASHRRAFSKAIKTFNKSYNADIYLDEDSYEVINRRCITLDSSSESDCVVEEKPKVHKGKGKKLRNPFNIIKRRLQRSERLRSQNNAGTSKDITSGANKTEPKRLEQDEDTNKYSETILRTFDDTWLPKENDFGRAEVTPIRYSKTRLIDSNKEQYLYEFMKDQFQPYENWVEAKISFLKYLEETNIAFENEQARIIADSELSNSGLRPLIGVEDNLDMPTVLEKLRIVKNNNEYSTETSLSIDFDVYNRDVQNFRKRSPPTPHIRIICLEESSGFPSAAEVMALHSKYKDNVAIVFAIVGLGSISYLQINAIDLPIYVPHSDVV